MSGIIFIHCQTFARKPNRIGQCVSQVIAEGLRAGEYHPHVPNPRPPIPLFGDPAGFAQMHAAHVAERRTCAVTQGRAGTRAIRKDRHTLFTIVASYPGTADAVTASEQEQDRFRRWVRLTLNWVRQQYGDQLKAAFAHTDERHPHLHFWLLPDDPGADAALLHPGKRAKREVEAGLKSEGTPPREAVKAGNRALKDAMRAWIDDYHQHVGAPLGMSRDGPKRRRLSRAQHQAECAMMAHHQRLEEDRARLEAKVAAMVAQQNELQMKAGDFVERAKRHHERMRAEAAQVAALGPMLDALVTEIENRTIHFDPEAGWRVRDPGPFHAAGRIWVKLEPAIRRLVGLVQAAEDGQWTAGARGPAPCPLPRPEPASLEASARSAKAGVIIAPEPKTGLATAGASL